MYSYDGNVLAYVHSVIDVRESKEKEKQLVQAKDAFFNMLKDLDSTYKESSICLKTLTPPIRN
jgi:hypothetical protein